MRILKWNRWWYIHLFLLYSPNVGFVRQLQLFEKMKCHVNVDHVLYRRLLMEIERRRK
jgi:hypothetical protein